MIRYVSLLLTDLISFVLSVALTYVMYAQIKQVGASLLVATAYSRTVAMLAIYFVIILNLFGLYHPRKPAFQVGKLILVCVTFFVSLTVFSYLYPKYQFSRFLLFINLTFIFFFITCSRIFMQWLLEKIR